ncbi:hypothetical protein V1264_010335 [Littorina saxatilis]|uniref:RING-type E3 ubiquitin transferase n=2 Tax=Littorina saxatilis TaxID=31220 RepID=A0AAN9G055_9CAEN
MAGTSASTIGGSNKDSLEDCMCTICLCILIHPVTLPCGHELCRPCFKQTVEEASLSCPMCRTRISTWSRKASKAKTLVNQERWEQIQRLFPGRVQRRLDGLDDETDEETEEREEIDVCYRRMVQLSKPGEIRQEYEAELKRLEEQQEAERQQEEEASVDLIQRLRSKEEREEEELRHQLEEIAARDARLAEELGKVINEAEGDTPVNRLLQESKDNYPNRILQRPNSSTPTLTVTPSRVKDQLVKNNKTLETFFRRLPAGVRTASRCSSEPKTGPSEKTVAKSGGSGLSSTSTRPESVPPGTDKENLPQLASQHSLPASSSQPEIYEEIDVGETYSRESVTSRGVPSREVVDGEVDIGETYSRTCATSREVEIGETYARDLVTGRRVKSQTSVHFDSSDCVTISDEGLPPRVKIGGGEDSRFRPIQSSPKTPPCMVTNSLLEPCVVRITPRILFSTRSLSTTTFPIVSSCVTPSIAQPVGQSKPDMGALKTKLLGEGTSTELKPSSAANGCVPTDELHVRRARSVSPPRMKVIPRSQKASYDDSHKSPYSRSSLKDFRQRRKHYSPVQESLSDTEVEISSPHRLMNGLKPAAKKTSREARNVREVKIVFEGERSRISSDTNKSRLMDNRKVLNDAETATGKTKSPTVDRSVSPVTVNNTDRPSSPGRVERRRPLSPQSAKKRSRSDSQQQPELTTLQPSESSSASSLSSSSSSKPLGIFNPATVPPWTDALYTDTVKGKGKRLVKKSVNGVFSQRNSPKKTVSVKKAGKPDSGKKIASAEKTVDAEKLNSVSKVLPVIVESSMGDRAKKVTHVNGVDQHKTPKKNRSNSRSGSGTGKKAVSGGQREVAQPASKLPSLDKKDVGSVKEKKTSPAKKPSPLKTAGEKKTGGEQVNSVSATDRTQNGDVDNPIEPSSSSIDTPSTSVDNETDNTGKLVQRVKRQNTAPTALDQESTEKTVPVKATSKPLENGKKSSAAKSRKVLSPQRSIKDWFSPKQVAASKLKGKAPIVRGKKRAGVAEQKLNVNGKKKTGVKKSKTVSTSESEVSDLSSASSSSATSPEKFTVRASSRAKKVNPKLNAFVLSNKLQQLQAHASPSKTDITSPKSTPSKSTSSSPTKSQTSTKPKRQNATPSKYQKSENSTPSKCQKSAQPKSQNLTATQSQKRKLSDSPDKNSPAKMRKLSPSKSPSKRDVAQDAFSSGEEEEGLTQEEKDLRLALRLQRQFDLADKLNLNIVRFKGTDDQYSLRESRSESNMN